LLDHLRHNHFTHDGLHQISALGDAKLPLPVQREDTIVVNTGPHIPSHRFSFLRFCKNDCFYAAPTLHRACSSTEVVRPLSLSFSCIPVTVGVLDGVLLVDPTEQEERALQGSITCVFAMPSGALCYLHQVVPH
jgi:exosome complex RNA-binding protein Rrp42 (RNase PH superfamily)